MQNFNKDGQDYFLALSTPHPGPLLKEELDERQILYKDFAKSIGMLPNNLSQLFAEKRGISVKTALKIEKELGISAEYWCQLQLSYDLYSERIKLH